MCSGYHQESEAQLREVRETADRERALREANEALRQQQQRDKEEEKEKAMQRETALRESNNAPRRQFDELHRNMKE